MDGRMGSAFSARLAVVALLLGAMSAGLPWLLVFGLEDPVEAFDSPAQVAYFRLLVGGLALSLVLGILAVLFGVRQHHGSLRYAGMVLAGLGILFCLGFLLIIAGPCGPAVLWGYCRP